jgi:hypothetical protein
MGPLAPNLVRSRNATPAEYRDLLRLMRVYGYRVAVVKRVPRDDR